MAQAPAEGPKPGLTMTPLAWLLLVGLAVLWGAAFFFIGVAVRELPTFTIVVLRVGLAAVALWAYVLIRGIEIPRTLAFWAAVAVMGAFNSAFPFILITWGQSHIPSGLASIFVATTPLFAVFAAHFLTDDERLTPLRAAGVATGFAGVVVLIGPGLLADLGTNILAQIAVLCAASSYALSGIYGRRFRRDGIPPLVIATGQVSAAAVILAPVMLYIDRPWTLPMPGIETMAAILCLAFASTALAYLLFFRILAIAGATNLMLVNFLVPVTAILLGVFVLGESLGPEHLAGMAVIFCGLVLIDGKLLSRVRRTP